MAWYTTNNTPLNVFCEKLNKPVSYKAGSLFQAVKVTGCDVEFIPVIFQYHHLDDKVVPKPNIEYQPFTLSAEHAKQVFVKPSKNFDSIVEEAIMQSEANYC